MDRSLISTKTDGGPAPLAIGPRLVGPGQPVLVIAEIGNNHNGDFDRAVALIDAAVAAGADCAKFQMRQLDEVYRGATLAGRDDDLAVEYTLDLLRRFELPTRSTSGWRNTAPRRACSICARRGIAPACACSTASACRPSRWRPPT